MMRSSGIVHPTYRANVCAEAKSIVEAHLIIGATMTVRAGVAGRESGGLVGSLCPIGPIAQVLGDGNVDERPCGQEAERAH